MQDQSTLHNMLDNRSKGIAGYRMAGKYLAVIQPFSALLAIPRFRTANSLHAYMDPCLRMGSRAGRQAGRQAGTRRRAGRQAGRQARRHAGKQARRQARRHAGTQTRTHAGTQARTHPPPHAHGTRKRDTLTRAHSHSTQGMQRTPARTHARAR